MCEAIQLYQGDLLAGLALGGLSPGENEASPEASAAFVEQYCGNCHNATDWAGGVAFDTLDIRQPGNDAGLLNGGVNDYRS